MHERRPGAAADHGFSGRRLALLREGSTMAIAAALLTAGVVTSGPSIAAPLASSARSSPDTAPGAGALTKVQVLVTPRRRPGADGQILAAPPNIVGRVEDGRAMLTAVVPDTGVAEAPLVAGPDDPGASPPAAATTSPPIAEPVPESATAFADRAERGPIASLFAAARNAVTTDGSAEAKRTIRTAAAPAGLTAPLVAGHGGSGAASSPEAFSRYGRQSGSLRNALDALKGDRYEEAIRLRNGFADPIDRMIVDYFLVRSSSPAVTSAMVADFAARAGTDWPSASALRGRAEEALSRENPDPDTVIRAMGGAAQSPAGVRLLAKALIARGDRERGLRMVRAEWHGRALGAPQQAGYAADFADAFTVEDHLARIDRLVSLERFEEAKALRPRLGPGPRAYVDARLAAAANAPGAAGLLAKVPAELRSRNGYRLAQIELLRHADDFLGAAKLIESAPKISAEDSDAWWVETRIVSRSLAETGEGRRAYRLAAKGIATGSEQKADEAFHAGWFALAQLKDGRTADKHFAALEEVATTPISLARAGYWRGRAADLRNDRGAARQHYGKAAKFGFTYYGQLSRAALGVSGTGVNRAPAPSAADRAAFARNGAAEAVRRLIANGHGSRIYPLLDHLAETVPTAGQVVLTAELATRAKAPHLALMVAKEGQKRGLPVGGLAYPTEAIPRSARVPSAVDRAVVYAIARQESEFNAGAKSPAGARGLMQVMPQTAVSMARELGIPHSAQKLDDPAHNATLGSAYLEKRLGDFDGSYILTFAAYNAGATRVRDWITRFGDPRDPRVDPVAWVESIPYPETRNYVQRVLENVQVYREELGTGRLAIDADLRRGRTS